MTFAEDDDVVQALAAYRADYAFHIRILPRSSGCYEHFVDPHVPDAITEVLAVDAVAIPEQESGSLVVRERLDDLLSSPLGSRIGLLPEN